jgi:hypothetical protein
MDTNETIKFNTIPQKVKTKRSNNFREITQDRVLASFRDGYFIYMIQNEEFDTNQEVTEGGCFIDEVQVKLSPQMMVKMNKLFGQLIKNYERIFGEIKSLDQIVSEKPDLFKDPSSES